MLRSTAGLSGSSLTPARARPARQGFVRARPGPIRSASSVKCSACRRASASDSADRSSGSAANSRIVSSIQKRSPERRRRLLSSSDSSESRSGADASAASSVQPPRTPTAGRRALRLGREQVVAPLDRRPQRLLAWVGVAARLQQVEPPARRSSSCSAESTDMLAAASSIASGRPSRRGRALRSAPGLARRRSQKSATLSSAASGGSSYARSAERGGARAT